MPRAKKTMTGEQGQAAQQFKGQTYGEGVQQKELQQTMPSPQLKQNTPMPTPQTQEPISQTSTPQPQQAQVPVTEMLKGMGGSLLAPDDNPALPITDGLASGAGRGPEAMQRPINKTGILMRQLALQTGDSIFAQLAQKAGF
jgi:hypothetical protein